MELTRRTFWVYALLAAVWALVLGWQVEEHVRVREAAKSDLRNRSKDIAKTVSAFIRGLRFRGTILQERLEPVLKELVNGRTNELVTSSEVLSIALLNAAGEAVASAGPPVDLEQKDLLQEGERWGRRSVTLVNPVDLGASLTSEGATNPTVVLPPMREFTNAGPEGFRGRGFPRREPPADAPPADGPPPRGPPPDQPPPTAAQFEHRAPPSTNDPHSAPTNELARAEREGRFRDGPPRSRRPFWMRNLDETEFQALMERRALHGLVLAMSTETFHAVSVRDLWLRAIIILLATISVAGSGLAWRNLAKSSGLQIRLVRASELNTHLKEMNLAAAGLAHETRNPLNIIRGLAQMISKRDDAVPEVRQKSREIVDEADKVAAQLNEFINYSRPREVRRVPLALGSAVNEVVRALNYDLHEKKVHLEVKGDALNIEADEQLLRQALFNLLLNAVQAVDPGGHIEVVARKLSASEAALEVADDGPGVPADRRSEIFKPYFTTQKQGTGLGLAVVQQIVLAHGWEIQCLPNPPKGALFRITHLKLRG